MSARAIGVDVGGTKIETVVIDEDGVVLSRTRRATPHVHTDPPGAATADAIAASVHELVGDDVSLPLGVGLPGMMTYDGVLAYAPNLPTGSGARLEALLAERRVGQHVLCLNDADCAAIAEHRAGAARGVDDFVMVNLGTGIGGGIVSRGTLLRGRSGFAGEIGHMVVDPTGPRCPCGNRGCWERYASGAGLARLAREAATAGRLPQLVAVHGDAEAIRGEHLTAAAEAGSEEALAVIDEVGWWLALGVANLTAILDVDLIVIGGGLSSVANLLVPAARRHLHGMLEGDGVRPEVRLASAHFGERSGAIGAAMAARED